MPFADYKDHADCVSKNKDKADPDAYCATIERNTKKAQGVFEVESFGVHPILTIDTTEELWLGDTIVVIDDQGKATPTVVDAFTSSGVILRRA